MEPHTNAVLTPKRFGSCLGKSTILPNPHHAKGVQRLFGCHPQKWQFTLTCCGFPPITHMKKEYNDGLAIELPQRTWKRSAAMVVALNYRMEKECSDSSEPELPPVLTQKKVRVVFWKINNWLSGVPGNHSLCSPL